jgi:tetratricopeptide (TPR) repeat protein
MAFLETFRSRRLARRARRLFADEGWEPAVVLLDAAGKLGAASWAELAVLLYNEGHGDDAERAVRRALDLHPDRGDALIFLAELLTETGRIAEAVATYRRLLARFPMAALQALELAKLLSTQEAFEDARAVLLPFAGHDSHQLRLTLAKLQYELGDHHATVALLAPSIRQMKLELQGAVGGLSGAARGGFIEELDEAMRLHDDAYAAIHGREAVIESARERGDLNARAGVNYRLLGEARMTHPRKWMAETGLRTVEDGLAHGQSLIARGERSRGLCHVGLSRLRQGRLGEAQRLFDQARAEDDDNFAAYLGLGAAIELERDRAFDRIAELPQPAAEPPGLQAVVIDWPVLTTQERRVATLMAAPLAGLLPRIAAASAHARVLPIDARVTDLPELAEVVDDPQQRFDDHRCLGGITGVSTERVCASKIEDLLHVTASQGSVFAHELAHLAHFHAPRRPCNSASTTSSSALPQRGMSSRRTRPRRPPSSSLSPTPTTWPSFMTCRPPGSSTTKASSKRPSRSSASWPLAQPLLELHGHGIARLLVDCLAGGGLDRELVGAVAQRHE